MKSLTVCCALNDLLSRVSQDHEVGTFISVSQMRMVGRFPLKRPREAREERSWGLKRVVTTQQLLPEGPRCRTALTNTADMMMNRMLCSLPP